MDTLFPADELSISWLWSIYGIGPIDEVRKVTDIPWSRAQTLFPQKSVFGDDGISYDDVKQGELRNNWALSAALAIAEKPERLMN